MPDQIAAIIAFSQLVILLTVLIVWISEGTRYWRRQSNNMSSVSWGAALLVLSFWRTTAWLDSHTSGIIVEDYTWALTLIIWSTVSLICFMNFVIWLRGDKVDLPPKG